MPGPAALIVPAAMAVARAAPAIMGAARAAAPAARAAAGGANLAGTAARAAGPQISRLGENFAASRLGMEAGEAAVMGRGLQRGAVLGADAWSARRNAQRSAERRGPMP